MALTATLVRSENIPEGKVAYITVQFDSSYPTNGETIDLSAAALGGFSSVISVTKTEGPYASDYTLLAINVCTDFNYVPAASRAVATGKLRAFNYSATDATGVFQEVGNTTDLSTVYGQIKVVGT